MKPTLLLLSLSCFACGGVFPAAPGAPAQTAPSSLRYSPGRDGFVVHEWGTLTSVVGSDGVLLPGLHHEEEDLPPFVADRMKQMKVTPSVVQKMETPVTYFYSPSPRQVQVKVRFPDGIFTQWYPF